MATQSRKKSVVQQLAIWLLLGTLAAFGICFGYAALSDFWLLIILWANG